MAPKIATVLSWTKSESSNTLLHPGTVTSPRTISFLKIHPNAVRMNTNSMRLFAFIHNTYHADFVFDIGIID